MNETLLETIDDPEDLRRLSISDLEQLAGELREFIIDIVSTKKGHLGASLGTVELTIALHYFFQTPQDKLIWDVGHQAYGHKILTGRRDKFVTNRKLHGLSGFPNPKESIYDTFSVGHSSTSISAGLGMAISDRLQHQNNEHIVIIGDASLASGMAFEGLNHAGVAHTDIWIILNDNGIGIDPSVGALKEYLNSIKLSKTKPENNIFEALNFYYEGPVNGHDFHQLFAAFKKLQHINGPKFLHLITTKGKGLPQAEKDQTRFHSPGLFDKNTGKSTPETSKPQPPKFQDVFGLTLTELADRNEKIIGVTPAMPTGSSLKFMMNKYPERTFDVGIAEQHAVTFSAGMASRGNIVFCAIYSTFLQRGYDQLIHDVALQDLPVIFCIDRAGLVGEDGPTHHGIFDIAHLRCIPNMQICVPSDEIELRQMLFTVSQTIEHPTAIRYPRGRGRLKDWKKPFETLAIGRGRCLTKGESIAVLSVGPIKTNVSSALTSIEYPIAHYDMRFVKPLDKALLQSIFEKFHTLVTVEDGVITGGFGDAVIDLANFEQYRGKIVKCGIPDQFIPHGSVEELQEITGLSTRQIKEVLERELKSFPL